MMPAEWEQHRATWLAWPKNKSTWPGPLLKEVESIYLQMMEVLLPYEKVNLLIDHRNLAPKILKALRNQRKSSHNLVFYEVRTADAWIRDYGAIFVRQQKKIAFTKWNFNAWGGKYSDLAKDNQVVDRIGALKSIKRFDPPMILEGGSIDVNGRGVCLTTEQCLLNSNRNAKFSRKKIEKTLNDFLGIKKMIWLRRGIEGDDTDGHVDDMARFVNPRTVVTATEKDSKNFNYGVLKENLEILKSATDQDGKRLRVIELPMPGRIEAKKRRLPASYANFYIANKVVLAPIYHHSHDKLAIKILRDVFPGRKIVGIDCTALVHGQGSIHCVTQQEPK
ncbi:MAG: hypothetical protein AUJ72_02275 [Candidatus Omnitrophica bacterium CG1_02_46_14]|nr:MAG: hypothetical protein AUJ72_02275 [Candidatus Omnitrophica bacterium CG1_02_46_14]